MIMGGMLRAFAALHAKGTVHGDIHSGNVLITEAQSVKLIDLGLSINKSLEEKQVVKYGGVDFYMPPERINITSAKKFSRAPDFQSDVYQIGMLMYLALYDSFPFSGFIWEELAASIKGGDIPYPEHTIHGHPVPGNLKLIISNCLMTDPRKRFKDAGALLQAFEKEFFPENTSLIPNAQLH
jgi:serine/threonine-protein kinase